MRTRYISPFRLNISSTLPAIVVMIILAACGSTTPTAVSTQPRLPTQAPTQALQPANAQPSVATQAPVQIQPPADTQAAAPTSGPSGYTLTSVCPLVTKDEAEAALGSPVKDPVEQNVPPVFGCRYNDSEGIYFVDIAVVEFPDAAQAASVFQMAIDINHYPEVTGIGDRAYRSEIYDITVDKGKYELSISVVSADDKDTRYEKARTLAELALARLP